MTLALDRPLAVTFFDGYGAATAARETVSLRALLPRLRDTTALTKPELPWVKIATHGDLRTDKNSLRHDKNVLSIDGIEADYDLEVITPEEAAGILDMFDVAGVVYTSPSHSLAKPRWRILCPTSRPLPPAARAGLLARLSGVFAGTLSGESFTLSQAYYFGSVNSSPAHRVIAVEGRYIDEATELPEVGKRGKAVVTAGDDLAPMPGEQTADGAILADLAAGLVYHESLRDLAARYIGRGMRPADVDAVLRGFMESVVPTERDKRWRERVAEIPRLVSSAVAKFAPPAAPIGADFFDPWDAVLPRRLFPMDSLPPTLAEVAQDSAELIGADPAAVAMAQLAAVAAAADGRTRLRVKRHNADWIENPRLWVMLVGDPSSKKTPVINGAMGPLKQFQSTKTEAHKLIHDLWERTAKVDRVGPEPMPPRYILNDCTTEKAAEILASAPRGVLAHFDELSMWIGGMEQYTTKAGGGANRAFWLQAYQGGDYTQDRIARGTTFVPNLSISILGGIQPDRLRKVAGGLTDDGLLQRFLPIMMGKAGRDVDRRPCDAHAAHRAHVQALLEAPARSLYLDERGHEIRESAFDSFDVLETADGLGKGFTSWAGKMTAFMMRLCLALHFADPASLAAGDGLVPAETVEKAAELMNFVRAHAIAFYRGMTGDAGEHTRQIADWILLHPEKTELTRGDFTRGPRCCRSLIERELAEKIGMLVTGEWLLPMTDHASCSRWKVAEGIHTRFAEKAKEAAKKRVELIEIINDVAPRLRSR